MFGLQEQLIADKENQLSKVMETVVSSVGDTIQTELKLYSEAVAVQGQSGGGNLLNQSALKCVVKDVVAAEDPGRNMLLFGLQKEADEDTMVKVGEVFSDIDEKPKLDTAIRLGAKGTSSKPRPVKVSVNNSITVSQILRRARKLQESEKFKSVFICIDRSSEERAEHGKLVNQLKVKRSVEPNKRFYIKGNVICSNDQNHIV